MVSPRVTTMSSDRNALSQRRAQMRDKQNISFVHGSVPSHKEQKNHGFSSCSTKLVFIAQDKRKYKCISKHKSVPKTRKTFAICLCKHRFNIGKIHVLICRASSLQQSCGECRSRSEQQQLLGKHGSSFCSFAEPEGCFGFFPSAQVRGSTFRGSLETRCTKTVLKVCAF